MKTFKEFIAESAEAEIDYLMLELTEEVSSLPQLKSLTEGRWEPAGADSTCKCNTLKVE